MQQMTLRGIVARPLDLEALVFFFDFAICLDKVVMANLLGATRWAIGISLLGLLAFAAQFALLRGRCGRTLLACATQFALLRG